jgi:hypothetical protein
MIKLKDLLSENYEVVDLRDPSWVPADDYDKKVQSNTMLSIHGGKIYKFRWGRGNTRDWEDVAPISGFDNSMMVLTAAGNLVLPNRVGGNTKWEGGRNIFTDTTKEWTKIMVDAGVILPSAKVYSGNWASLKGTFLGKAKDIIERDFSKLPRKLVFYHGTSSDRLEDIKQYGLRSMPIEQRPWKSDVLKHHPEYRENAVYLTYSKSQANYYAKKAVAVARRNNKRGTKMVVLKVTIPSSAYKRLLPDDDYLMRQLMQLGVTWIDSLKNFSQVAYLGAIPPEWIQVEYIEKYGWIDEPSINEEHYAGEHSAPEPGNGAHVWNDGNSICEWGYVNNPDPNVGKPKFYSKSEMIQLGADGYLSRARLAKIPVSKIDGREPVPEPDSYVKGTSIKQPIEVAYDAAADKYMLYSGNHRVRQAEVNGDKYIIAFVGR